MRVMIDLAEHQTGAYIPMKDVAKRQDISLKYLEKILPALAKNNFIVGVQGKGGGYRLTRKPEEYRVGDLLRLTEGELAPVACLACGAPECKNAANCRTRPMWDGLNMIVNDYLDKITIADLMKQG